MFEEALHDPFTGIARKCARYLSAKVAVEQYDSERRCKNLGWACDCKEHQCQIKRELGIYGVRKIH